MLPQLREAPKRSEIRTIGNATLYHADCQDAFKWLESKSIDLIATDPPYFLEGMDDQWSDSELIRKQAKAGTIGGLPVGMKFDPEQGKRLQRFFDKISLQALRVLKPGGFMLSFSQGRLFHRLAVAVEDAGFEIRDMFIWEHEGGQGKAFTQDHFVRKMKIAAAEKQRIIKILHGRKTPQLRPKFEAILLAQKPKDGTFVENWMKWKTGLVKTDFNGQQTTIFSYKKPRRARLVDHMTPKPVDLMERLIEVFSMPKQTILDPFMGSGSTGIAALATGRKFIGFELEKKYFDASERRIREYGKSSKTR